MIPNIYILLLLVILLRGIVELNVSTYKGPSRVLFRSITLFLVYIIHA